ncbi:hypothetical protein GRI58_08510 [Porphyrobacter algicida]|uniref:Uncharacterized protein n=1 Tax=Qipengyuania algicida TaxID=1836209 RepID=A0A845AEC9_9SPHN|nr:hypothetical protein [Qipengyuania algicida]MXP28862.1 hypothetical protein [Qipengyuania algicida]
MRTFTIRFEDDGKGEPKSVEFEGVDPLSVFSILQGEKFDRRVGLWEGNVRLGSLMRDSNNVWSLV